MKLLEQLRNEIRVRHYSIRTEHTYADWVVRYVKFHKLRHPAQMGTAEINSFLTHLAVEGNVTASTQNQALCSLLFLYRHVLHRDPGDFSDVVRAKRPQKLPVILSPAEVQRIMERLDGTYRLMCIGHTDVRTTTIYPVTTLSRGTGLTWHPRIPERTARRRQPRRYARARHGCRPHAAADGSANEETGAAGGERSRAAWQCRCA